MEDVTKKPLRKLTRKQKGFVKDYIETGNGTQAVMNNYNVNSPEVAKVIASQNLTKLNVKLTLAERIPDDLLETVHLEGLKAMREGEKDYSVRHKYLDSAYKLKGAYAATEINQNVVNLNIDATNPKVLEALRRLQLEVSELD